MKKKVGPKGMVYIVGAGPGNPKLLTLRAVECLAMADVVLHDRLISKDVLTNYAPQAKLMYVGKKASFHTLAQDEIEDLLVRLARQGKVVVRLKGGDPYIFGRGAEEALSLSRAHVPFEVVPGITSALAAPLYAGIPLTHRNFTSGIAIVTGHENPKKGKLPYQHGVEREASGWVSWPALAKMGTVVFLMGVGNLRANMWMLKKYGKMGDTPVAVVRWGSLGKQRSVVGTIDTIADSVQRERITAPAVVVVGGVAGFAQKLNWFEKLPLFGKVFLITRGVESNTRLAAKLQDLGADVLSLPGFSVSVVPTTAKVKKAITGIKNFDWLIFKSQNAVKYFLEKYFSLYGDYRPLATVKIAAIGPETAKRLKEERLPVDVIPKENSSQGLASLAVFRKSRRLKIFIPQAADGRSEFEKVHARRHYIVAAAVYKKKRIRYPPQDLARLKEKKIDAVLFYSPSAVAAFVGHFKKPEAIAFLQNTRVAVVGKTTERSVKDFSQKIVCVPIAEVLQME